MKNMRKLIISAAIILILISVYRLSEAVFGSPQVKPVTTIAVATTPTPGSKVFLASTTPTPDPTPQSTPTPTIVSTGTFEPLKIRIVKHQPDQFRKGAISAEEFSAIEQAIKNIPWSLNSNPKAAANEDYAAIVKACEESGVHDLLTDLVTEAVSNDYQPNNEAANSAYTAELNSDFEKGDQNGDSHGKSSGKTTAGDGTTVDSGSNSGVSEAPGQPNATSASPAERPASTEVVRSKISHGRHRLTVRHRIVDVKTQLLALWHQSLAEAEKSPKPTPMLDAGAKEPRK
jgi:hypothetical protein